MQAIPYNESLKDEWDEIVRSSRNGTFLFERDYMDYHAERFPDASLIFLDDKGKPLGGIPATIGKDGRTVSSHAGLTYGGLLLPPNATTLVVRDMWRAAARHYGNAGCEEMLYKPVPHIYHGMPCEEDLYWLFRAEARLVSRAVSTAVPLPSRLPLSPLRRRKTAKARKAGLAVAECESGARESGWDAFWELLGHVLLSRHHVRPVHSLSEISRLRDLFPERIRLFLVRSSSNETLAGCVAYVTDRVAHIQYIAAGEEGRATGALDLLFDLLIGKFATEGKSFLDFGISTENGGLTLNEGLVFQKEGFGGRAICYDTYRLRISRILNLMNP